MADLRFNFTKKKLDKLPTPSDNSVTYHDTNNRWLKLLVAKSGSKTFRNVRKVNERMLRTTLGKFPRITIARDP